MIALRFLAKLAIVAPFISNIVSAQTPSYHVCVQDCLNQNSEGLSCVGIDPPCICGWDNGAFYPKWRECVAGRCGEVAAAFVKDFCAGQTGGNGNGDGGAGGSTSVTVVTTTSTGTIVGTIEETVIGTTESTIESPTTSLIGDNISTVITGTDAVVTTITFSSETTKTLTFTTVTTGNITSTILIENGTNQNGSITVVPSTAFTTFTSAGTIITSAISTVARTSTIGGDYATDTPTNTPAAAAGVAPADGGLIMVAVMGLGMVAGFFAL